MPPYSQAPLVTQGVSWEQNDPSLFAPTFFNGLNNALFTWGMVQFQVFPLNVHDADHETESDWAHKEIAGAAIYREWVGENDEVITIRGDLFPYRIGGLSEIEVFDAYRRGGIANLLLRGDGIYMGWFVCEKLVRAHTFLSGEGVGQQIAFQAIFARVPVPGANQFFSQQWGVIGAQG